MEEKTEDKVIHVEGKTYNSEEHTHEWTSENLMNEMSHCGILPKADAVTGESFNTSDSGSYSSDTPLLAGQRHDANQLSQVKDDGVTHKLLGNELDTADKDDKETCDTFVYVEIDPTLGHLAHVERQMLGSGVSLALSHTREFEKVKTNPVHVFGSGWEFGSVCSINLHTSDDSTMPQRNARAPAPPWQDRLLSRIFKDKIESLRVDKNPGKESEKFIYTIASDSPESVGHSGERKNLKNLLILSTSITFLYVAVFGLRNLQSSINSENGLGVLSLASLSGAFLFGSLVSPFVVRRYRPKLCLSWSCFGHLLYVIANYYPNFYVIIPASVIHGLSSALLWNALCTYITEIGLDESFVKNKISSSVLSRYFGIFFLMLQLSMVLGNLISSLILSQAEKRIKVRQTMETASMTGTVSYDSAIDHTTSGILIMTGNESISQMRCGGAHCDLGGGNETKPAVDDLDKLFLLGTYSSCAIISILVIQCFLDQLSNYTSHSSSLKTVLKQAGSVLAMMVDRKFCFVVLLCLYTAISSGFVIADVLKAFITCPVGVRMVGYSMICFGICGSVSSYMFGKLSKCVGHVGAFFTAAVLNLTSLGFMVSWQPSPEDQYLLFALIGAWGFADGIWQSQINSLVSSVFADRYETAFGCCRVLQGLAGIIVFTMSNMVCMRAKIIFTATVCVLSMAMYLVMEIRQKRTKKV